MKAKSVSRAQPRSALLALARGAWPDMDRQTLMLFGGIGAFLLLASLIGWILKLRTRGTPNPVIDNLNARINAWWVMVAVIGIAFWLGTGAVILLFYAVSFYALREFITLTPTRRSDYPALVAAFYLALPLQYLLIYFDWYGLFSIFIPVYVFLLLPILASLGGDSTHFLERASKVQWGLMIAVFCVSPRAGPADPGHSRLRGPQPAADRLPGDRGADCRTCCSTCAASCSANTRSRPTCHRRRPWKASSAASCLASADRRGAVVDHARSTPGSRPDRPADQPDGLCSAAS